VAREFGDNDTRGAASRKRSKGEQGQRGDAHLAENITPAVRQSQDNGLPSSSYDLGKERLYGMASKNSCFEDPVIGDNNTNSKIS
jgi:hypothetical protein